MKQWQLPAGVTRGMWDYAQSANIANTYDDYFQHHELLKLDWIYVLPIVPKLSKKTASVPSTTATNLKQRLLV